MIRHETKWSMLLSLRVQICLLSSVEFLCFAWQNDAVSFLYLVLKTFSVSLMHVSQVFLSWHLMVAWLITDDWRQFPLRKHIWALKDGNMDHCISWHIISTCSSYNSSIKRCNLYLREKLLIICRPDLSSLSKCNKLHLFAARETKRCHVTKHLTVVRYIL